MVVVLVGWGLCEKSQETTLILAAELKKEETASRTHNYFRFKMQLPRGGIYKQQTGISHTKSIQKVVILDRYITTRLSKNVPL